MISFVSLWVMAAPGPRFDVAIQFTEMANLSYELDVVSGQLPQVDGSPYRELWEQRFLKTEADREQLANWKAVRERYVGTAKLSDGEYASIAETLRIASLRSATPAEYLDRVSTVVKPNDLDRLAGVLKHFGPGFHRWFDKEAKPKGKPFTAGMVKLFKGDPIRRDLEQFATFYAPDLGPKTQVVLSMLYRPPSSGPTTGQQMGSVGVVEFRPDEKPEQRIDVVIHEFCHFLYGSRSREKQQALEARMVATQDPAAKPALNLLNEGMATALGNGVVGRRFAKPSDWSSILAQPMSLYNNPNIDRAGKALIKLVDEWLPLGKSMDDPEFAPAYLQAMRAEFGGELERPAAFLSELYLFADDSIGQDGLTVVRSAINPASMLAEIANEVSDTTLAELRRRENLSAVFLVPPAQVQALIAVGALPRRAFGEIADVVEAQGSALYGHTRNPQARTYVIVAKDMTGLRRRVNQLMAAPRHFDGIAPEAQ